VARERLRRSGRCGCGRRSAHRATPSCWILEGKPLRLDQFSGLCCTTLRRAQARTGWALAGLLKPVVLLHLFLYAKAGRLGDPTANPAGTAGPWVWLTLQTLCAWPATVPDLPETTACAAITSQRWALEHSKRMPTNFADMYLHPQETSYRTSRAVSLSSKASGLNFAGFSNPQHGESARLLAGGIAGCALAACPRRQQWALVGEASIPEISHFEVLPQPGGPGVQLLEPRRGSAGSFGRRNPCSGAGPWGEPADPDLASQ